MSDADTTHEAPGDRRRLADAVRHRRLTLGLSVRAAADAAGIARGTWISLEDASRRTAETAYAAIERALQWAPGSVSAVLDGGEPRDRATQADSPSTGPSDSALITVMRSDKLTEADKAKIVRLLIAEQERFERERTARAQELIRIFSGEQ